MPNHIKRFLKSLLVALFLLLVSKPDTALAADPSFSLSPASGSYYQGQSFNVDINLNSGGNFHREAYVELDFDNTQLEVVSITNKELYWSYYDEDLGNATGKFRLRADFFGNNYSTSGVFATIRFKAISSPTSSNLVLNGSSYLYDSSSIPIAGLTLSGASISTLAPLAGAKLNILSQYDLWALDDTQSVIFELDTQGNDVAGVDLVVQYDKDRFQYQEMTWSGLLPNQQGFSVNQDTGTITISGVANHGSPINVQGEIVRFSFRALTVGASDFSLDWTLGSTTDTNIVDYHNVNTDLLTIAPVAKAITVGDGATLDFTFNLLGFLGLSVDRSGTVTVVQPSAISNFTTTVSGGAGSVLNHNLGTFAYGNPYDLVLKVQGYLKEKSSLTVNIGSNATSFGNLRPGDINNDGVINSSDLFQLYNYWNSTSTPVQDLNGDGKVNSFDVGLLYAYFNDVDNV